MKTKVYAQQIAPLIYQLVNERGIICDADGGHTDWPIQIVGIAEEQLEFPVWRKDKDDENHEV